MKDIETWGINQQWRNNDGFSWLYNGYMMEIRWDTSSNQTWLAENHR